MTDKQMKMAEDIQHNIRAIEQDIKYLSAYKGCFACHSTGNVWRLGSFSKKEEDELRTKMLETMLRKVEVLQKQFDEL